MKLDKEFFSDTPEKTKISEEYKQKQKDFIEKQLLQNDKIMLNGEPVNKMTIKDFIAVLLTLKDNYSKNFEDFNTNIKEIDNPEMIQWITSISVDHLKVIQMIESEMTEMDKTPDNYTDVIIGGVAPISDKFIYIIFLLIKCYIQRRLLSKDKTFLEKIIGNDINVNELVEYIYINIKTNNIILADKAFKELSQVAKTDDETKTDDASKTVLEPVVDNKKIEIANKITELLNKRKSENTPIVVESKEEPVLVDTNIEIANKIKELLNKRKSENTTTVVDKNVIIANKIMELLNKRKTDTSIDENQVIDPAQITTTTEDDKKNIIANKIMELLNKRKSTSDNLSIVDEIAKAIAFPIGNIQLIPNENINTVSNSNENTVSNSNENTVSNDTTPVISKDYIADIIKQNETEFGILDELENETSDINILEALDRLNKAKETKPSEEGEGYKNMINSINTEIINSTLDNPLPTYTYNENDPEINKELLIKLFLLNLKFILLQKYYENLEPESINESSNEPITIATAISINSNIPIANGNPLLEPERPPPIPAPITNITVINKKTTIFLVSSMKSIQAYRYVKEDTNSGINQAIFEERSRHDGVEINCNVENIDVNSYSGKLDCVSSDIFIRYEKIKNILKEKYGKTGDGGIQPILDLLNTISDHWNETDSNSNNKESPDRQKKNIELFYRFITLLNKSQYEFLLHAPIDPYVNTFLEKETVRNFSGGYNGGASKELLEKIGKQIQELLNKKKDAEPTVVTNNQTEIIDPNLVTDSDTTNNPIVIDATTSVPTTSIEKTIKEVNVSDSNSGKTPNSNQPVVGTVPTDSIQTVETPVSKPKEDLKVSDIKRFIIEIVDKDQLKIIKDLNDLNTFIQAYKLVIDTKYLDEENKSNLKKIITFILSNIEIEVTNNEIRKGPEVFEPLPVQGEKVIDEEGQLIKKPEEAKGELIEKEK